MSYYYNYVLPKVLLLEPNYNIIKNNAQARENAITNYFESWAFVVYGPSKTEREAGATILRKVVSIVVDFTPLGNVKMIQEGITGYDIITGEKLSPGTRVVEVILGCLPVVGVGIKKGYTTLKGLKEAATYSKRADLLKLAEDAEKIVLEADKARIIIRVLDPIVDLLIINRVKELRGLLTSAYKGQLNFGYANVSIEGIERTEYYAHSSISYQSQLTDSLKQRLPDISIKPAESEFTAIKVDSNGGIDTPSAFLRDSDSEFKILNDVYKQLGINQYAKGKIKLYTDLPPCKSCEGVIKQFSEKCPNIEIEVIHNNGNILLP